MLAITGTTGKIGGAVLDALLEKELVEVSDLVIITSSPLGGENIERLKNKYTSLRDFRFANYADQNSMRAALEGCSQLFLVSTPEIHLDFGHTQNNSSDNLLSRKGRESQHINAIRAAVDMGVDRVVYTSLAFTTSSESGVMRAHKKTEEYLFELASKDMISFISVREGLYNESWPLYLGHYDVSNEKRTEIVVPADGKVSWTSISDLGLATALILTPFYGDKYSNQTIFLSQKRAVSLSELAKYLDKRLRFVSPSEYVNHYHQKMGLGVNMLEWWQTTYPSLEEGHCNSANYQETSLLEELLATAKQKPIPIETTIELMTTNRSTKSQ